MHWLLPSFINWCPPVEMERLIDRCLVLLIPGLILTHLIFAPYTKVEESFNIQAVHDILKYGIPWKNSDRFLREHYDHPTFTGPVPRTFVGPLALAGASWPLIWLDEALGLGVNKQMIVRAVLGLFNACSLIYFRNGVAKAFGRNAANWYTVFQASQFHIMYYASRTLPNFFAFGLTTIAQCNLLPLARRRPSSCFVRSRHKVALTLLTITGIIFRSELALLLTFHTLSLYLQPHIRLPLRPIILSGLLGLLLGLTLTIPIDTYFWRTPHPLWPELTAFKYNILSGEASNWGTSPWHFYLTSALPRLLFNPTTYQICLPLALSLPIFRRPSLDILLPNVLFVAAYSFQPHKEWRFIIYTIPPILAVASAGASWIWTRRAKTFVYRVLSLALIASTLASFIASAGMLAVSRLNYPGAEALNLLHDIARNETRIVRVHVDTLACTTGVTRFLQREPKGGGVVRWVYDKTEDRERLLDPVFWDGVDYAVAETPERVIGKWELVGVVEGFAGLGIVRPGEGKGEGEVEPGLGEMEGGIGALGEYLGRWGGKAVRVLRGKVLGGRWVRVRMEPRLRVLRRQGAGG